MGHGGAVPLHYNVFGFKKPVGAQHAEPKNLKIVGSALAAAHDERAGASPASTRSWRFVNRQYAPLGAIRELPLHMKPIWALLAVPLQRKPFL